MVGKVKTVNPYDLSNDRFGYSVYGVVLFASEDQQRKVQVVRDAVRNRRSMLPAHVTVKGPVCEIPDLETIRSLVGSVASMTAPFAVNFEGRPDARTLPNGEVFAGQPIAKTLELVAVHNRLIEVLQPITTNAYRLDATGEYHPHLTIYHEPEPDLAAHGEKLLSTLDLGTGFEATGLHLVAHVGTPYRGKWELLNFYPFGR